MTYIILAAGKGINLQPLTLKYPKTSFKLDEKTSVLQRMVRKIRCYDNNAEIIVVIGFLASFVRQELADDNVRFVVNPFYQVTNSISSLWFARDYLERENVTVLNGDAVFEDALIREVIVRQTDYPYVLVDSSVKVPGAYNVVCKDNRIRVMSKKLESYNAKHSCVSKLDAVSARLLKKEIDSMINADMYDQFYEDALVQMIMFHDFQLFYKDIAGYKWVEVDSVDDLLLAQEIHSLL